MTQDDKEAMEREINALRGQVALLERNNKVFSDRERNELKQVTVVVVKSLDLYPFSEDDVVTRNDEAAELAFI